MTALAIFAGLADNIEMSLNEEQMVEFFIGQEKDQ